MFLREVTSKRKTGPDAVYVQLVHSDWDPEIEQSRTRILPSLGRKEELDTEQLRRLKEQCEAYLPPEERTDGDFEVTDSSQLGGPHLLDGP